MSSKKYCKILSGVHYNHDPIIVNDNYLYRLINASFRTKNGKYIYSNAWQLCHKKGKHIHNLDLVKYKDIMEIKKTYSFIILHLDEYLKLKEA